MAGLGTSYMGIELESPLVVAACSISSMINKIMLAQRAGAGALVIRSLFEEQIQLNSWQLKEDLRVGADSFPEALTYFPEIAHGEADEHLMWIEKTREKVSMPLIASLNAVTLGSWVKYARKLEETGVEGLELNLYSLPVDPSETGAQLEERHYQIVSAVLQEVSIPVAVKLSPFYSSLTNVAARLDRLGVRALVLFNRFLQPDIEVNTASLINEMVLSLPQELKLPLRWTAILSHRIEADIALNTGVHSGLDVAKALLAGASVVQVASALLKNGIPYISTMLRELEGWMEEHGYDRLQDFRGSLSQKKADNPLALERAHYFKLLRDQR